MKKIYYLLSMIVLFLVGCSDSVTNTVTYKINEPIFMSSEQFRSSVKVSAVPKPIEVLGKMTFYEGYLFISEPEKGIHIIDNRNPANPQIIGFIELIGNADLSVRNGLLYADSFVDLVWFDISNPAIPTLKGRLENVFITALPNIDNGFNIDYNLAYGTEAKGVIVGWELKERTEEVVHYTGGWIGGWRENDMVYASMNGGPSKGSNGINGSMSRFAIYEGHLYTVINNQMNVFDLDKDIPSKDSTNTYIGRNVETIFSYKNYMFMGTPTGMLIYSVKDPVKPKYVSEIQHVFGCDPVVVENDMAYVTIHSGNNCGQDNNDLFIVDVSIIEKPKQIASYAMKNPKGLGIDNNKLFLCDDGLKVFNAEKPQELISNLLVHYTGMDGFDVIPYNNILMMIANDGLYQYDYSNLNNIKQISKLKIGK